MPNTPDSISTADLKALYAAAQEKTNMAKKAPWMGTGESVGDPDLGIVQQAIDAVDDNCSFPIHEFLKGAHYSLYLYLRNIEAQLADAHAKNDIEGAVYLAQRLGQVGSVFEALGDTMPSASDDDDEDEDDA